MVLSWEKRAWNDYLEWQKQDSKVLQKINELIKDILRHPFSGIGKPEPLKHLSGGLWSRRIDRENRVVYFVQSETVFIIACKGHYD